MAGLFDRFIKKVQELPAQVGAAGQLLRQGASDLARSPNIPQEAAKRIRENRPLVEQKSQQATGLFKQFIDKTPKIQLPGDPTGQAFKEVAKFAGESLIDTLSGASALRGAEYITSPQRRAEVGQQGAVGNIGAAGDVLGLIPFIPGGTIAKTSTKVGKGAKILDDISEGFKAGRKIKETADKVNKPGLRTQAIDKLSPIFDLTKKAGKNIPTKKDPYKLLRLHSGVSGKINSYLEQNLKPILESNKDSLEDLSSLLTLDRNQELLDRGLKTRYSADDIKAGKDALVGKYGEGFQKLQDSAQAIRTYNNNLLTMLKDSGVIDQKSFDEIVKNNQNYVPFQVIDHIADNLERGNFARSSYNVASQDVIKSIKGSTYQIADPLEEMINKTAKIISLVDKNNAMKSLVDLPKINPDLKDVIVPVSGTVPKGMDVISLFENGKNVDYAVDPQVAQAIKNLNAQQTGLMGNIAKWQANVLRAGATSLNIAFIPVNVIRDVQDAVFGTITEKGAKAAADLIASYPAAIASAFKKDDLYQKWLQSGGAQSTFTSQIVGKNTPKKIADLAGNKPIVQKVFSKVNPKALLEFVGRVGEESTRLAKFRADIKSGKDPLTAAFNSRDVTIDFAKSGNATKTLNEVIPFLNAAVQGSERFFRLMKNNPKSAVVVNGLLAGTPAIILYNHNKNYQDYQDIPQYVKDANWVIIARDRTEEEKAEGKPIVGITIPKPFLGQPVSNLTEGFMRYLDQNDPQTATELAQSISGGLLPVPLGEKALSSVTPPILRAGLQSAANYDFFRGAPIVPQSLENVAPGEQYKEDTPDLIKKFGQATNISPLKIESGIQTLFGGLGKQVSKVASGDVKGGTVDEVVNRFTNIKQGAKKNEFYEETGKLKQESATESLKKKREAEKIYQEIKDLPKEAINAKGREIKDTDPKLFEKLKDIIAEQQKGLTDEDKRIISLPVKDGTRAEFLAKEIRKIKTKDEKNLYIDTMKRKKVITDEVFKQLQEIRDSEGL